MSKVRVYEIAKQLNMDQKSIVALFQSIGVGDVKNHMSAVEAEQVDRLKRHLERQKSPEVVEERIRPGVVKRRARPEAEGAPSVVAPSISAPPSAAASSPSLRASAPSTRGREEPSHPRGDVLVVEAAPSQERVAAPLSDRTSPSSRGAASSSRRSELKSSASRARSAGTSAATKVGDVDFDVEHAADAVATENASHGANGPGMNGPGALEVPSARPSQTRVVQAEPDPAPADEPVPPTQASGAEPAAQDAPSAASEPMPSTEPQIEAASPAPSAPPAREEAATPPPSEPPASTPKPIDPPKRPSVPPRTGIDVWQGRPGVPMPQTRSAAPPARRTTYDPRASTTPPRTMGPTSGFPQSRGPNRPGQRPAFGQQRFGRPGASGPSSKRPPVLTEMSAHKKVIKIEESVSLQKLASMMSLKVTDVLLKLLGMGMTGVNINSTIDADTAKILANEFGWVVEDVAVSEEQSLEAAMGLDDVAEYETFPRPPIVTVMGHVDHGKTSLLDRIRRASVAAGEAGGITQHIGAYRVETSKGTVSFLDTPGHEAFTAMRARGAQVTDIVVLVVAADDGVMPQTREAISHAQSAKVPIIVAVNKIDKPSADPDRVKRDLSGLGLTPEEWGGETLFCHVSALTGQGVDQLLESIALQAEVLELRAAPKRRAHGVVIEALLDRGRGPVARVMVQDGTLKTGDILIAGPAWGKVRAMTDELGRALGVAGPATPVEVLGLNEVPSAGDPVHAVKDAKTAEEIAEQRRKKANKSLIPQDSRVSLEALKERLAEGDQLELKLIVKGDVQGSVEAVNTAVAKLSTSKVKVIIVHAAVGAITEGDVNLAIASKAIIVGFNVRPAGKATQLAEAGGVEIRLYTIIYNAVDDIRAAMEGLLPTTKLEKALGAAEVRKVFRITKVGVIAGCYVIRGLVKRGAEARLVRDGIVVYTGKLSSLKRVKDDAKEVAEGLECGISLENFADIKEGDVIESFEIEEVKQKLT